MLFEACFLTDPQTTPVSAYQCLSCACLPDQGTTSPAVKLTADQRGVQLTPTPPGPFAEAHSTGSSAKRLDPLSCEEGPAGKQPRQAGSVHVEHSAATGLLTPSRAATADTEQGAPLLQGSAGSGHTAVGLGTTSPEPAAAVGACAVTLVVLPVSTR